MKNLQQSDTGSYTCRLCTKTNTLCDERSASLNVQTEPKFTKQPNNLSEQINSDILLVCEVTGEPKPTISWYKNGELIYPSEYFQYLNETNLRILGMFLSDFLWTCF